MTSNQISVNLYTQQGHDKYFKKFPNEKWFLHFNASNYRDQLKQMQDAILENCEDLVEGNTDPEKEYPWNFYNAPTNQFALYLFPESDMQEGDNLENLKNDIINICKEATIVTPTIMKTPQINPTVNLFLKIVIHL